MNSFQRKSLYAALAGAGALGMTATANAVSVNPNGLGQVLIYPYYTVNADAAGNAYNSLLSVVNTSSSAKAVKVRFLEGRNSREVLDFNLFLSKFDVWTAAIAPSTSGGGARVITADNSCTIPENSALKAGVNFVNFAYVGDGGGDGLDRTKEGYVEIIEMAAYTSFSCTSIVVTHANGTNNIPPCQSAKHPLSDNSAKVDASSAGGGLFGGITLINVGSGTAYTEDAVALNRFNMIAGSALYFNAGSVSPTLEFSGPKESVVYEGFDNDTASGGTVFNSDGTIRRQKNFSFAFDDSVYWASWEGPECLNAATGAAITCLPADAVSAVLMHNQVINEYVLDAATKSGTDWVITFPTKRFYVGNGTGSAIKLFQKNFNKTAFSCDDVLINIFDREERTVTTPQSFSPPTPGAAPTALCYEANVLTFNNTNVLGSKNVQSLSTGFTNGWLDIHLSSGTNLVNYHKLVNTHTVHVFDVTSGAGSGTFTWQGLPVIGFAVQSFTNGTLVVSGTNVLANYGGNFAHRYATVIN